MPAEAGIQTFSSAWALPHRDVLMRRSAWMRASRRPSPGWRLRTRC